MSNHTPAYQKEQPEQAHRWELTTLFTKTTRTFGIPTGHKVIIHTIEGSDYSHVSVHVTNGNAFVNMGYAYFTGCNHRQECEDYLCQRTSSPALEYVCMHFDALCNPFGDEDVA